MSVNRDKFNCQACRFHKHCDERNPAPFPMWVIPGVIESRTCLLPMVGAVEMDLLRWYQRYEKNVYPFAGGFLDQPNNYIEAMDVIADAVSNATKAKADGHH